LGVYQGVGTKVMRRVLRVLLVGVGATLLNLAADILFKVQVNSGRDWLIYFALLLTGMYFFVWK
jgi:hypothetical protein